MKNMQHIRFALKFLLTSQSEAGTIRSGGAFTCGKHTGNIGAVWI